MTEAQRIEALRCLEDTMLRAGDNFRHNLGHASHWTDESWQRYNTINRALSIVRDLLGEDFDDEDLTCDADERTTSV